MVCPTITLMGHLDCYYVSTLTDFLPKSRRLAHVYSALLMTAITAHTSVIPKPIEKSVMAVKERGADNRNILRVDH